MKKVRTGGMPLTISCKGSFVVPSENIDLLPMVNEYTLDPRKLTVAQDPFGGVNGLVSYSPGSVHVTSGDGIYLTDVVGNNSSKDLPAGLLSRLGYLTVDNVAHTITEEFIIANTATGNNPVVIDNCDATTGWAAATGTGVDGTGLPVISVENGRIKVIGKTDSGGQILIQKTFSYNATAYSFLCASVESSVGGSARTVILTGSAYKMWQDSTRFALNANTNTRYVYPLDAPQGTAGQLPSTVSGTFTKSLITSIKLGVLTTINTRCTFYVDNITADVAKSAYIELATLDNLPTVSTIVQCYDGTQYNETRRDSLDGTYANISITTANSKLLDGTKSDDAGLVRAIFPKGGSGATVTGSNGTMVYSANKGTKNRIGIRVDLPPSDGDRTNFNKMRLKVITYYTDVNKASNILPDTSGNGNNGTMSCVGLTADNAGNQYGAMSFDGVRSVVSIPNSPSNNPTSAITICARINVAGATFSSRNCILGKNSALAYQVGGETGTKKLQMYVIIGGTLRYLQSTSNITMGQWVDVVWQYPDQNSKIGIYINGVLDAESAVYSGSIGADTGILRIGSNGAAFYAGMLADVREYSRTLTPAEILAYHNKQSIDSTGLVAQWQPSTVKNMGSTTYELSNDNNASTGLKNISKAWLAVINANSKLIVYYVFSSRPKSLYYTKDESGNIYQIVVNPGFGRLYKGQAVYQNTTLDSNSDGKPDFLDATLPSSLARMLSMYRFNG